MITATTGIIDTVFATFRQFGSLSYGEEVSQMEHLLQCAWLASADGASGALIVAALLHDIGQFIEDAGNAAERLGVDAGHEITGAAFLAPYFPATITEPVRLHVEAKRYLCAVEPGYLETLSRASLLSLRLQGGAYTADEMQRFLAHPAAADAIRLRRYDDMAKVPGRDVPGLESYRPLLESLLRH